MDKHNFTWFVCGTSQLSWQPEKVREREEIWENSVRNNGEQKDQEQLINRACVFWRKESKCALTCLCKEESSCIYT